MVSNIYQYMKNLNLVFKIRAAQSCKSNTQLFPLYTFAESGHLRVAELQENGRKVAEDLNSLFVVLRAQELSARAQNPVKYPQALRWQPGRALPKNQK